jgi:hypothetical protein
MVRRNYNIEHGSSFDLGRLFRQKVSQFCTNVSGGRLAGIRHWTKDFPTTKWFMILRSLAEHENADHRHAGMDCRHPSPETSMSIWIPAFHAGMTQLKGSA